MRGSSQKPHGAAAGGISPGTRGWCIRVACELEASAPKPGNVHPGASFPDLSHADLLAAAAAIAPAFEAAPHRRLGATIRAAVTASRRVTRSNANLGIVLAAAPLAAVPDGIPPAPAAVARVLARLVPDDARDCWAAIAEARPGGMGTQARWDVAGEPPDDLVEAMRVAAEHDQIARLWSQGYEPLFDGPVADLERELEAGHDVGDAIVRTFLRQLAREPDSLIARKQGRGVASAISARAGAVLAADGPAWRDGARELERDLLAGGGVAGVGTPLDQAGPGALNPGTTADLVATSLYVLLATGRLQSLVGHAISLRASIARSG